MLGLTHESRVASACVHSGLVRCMDLITISGCVQVAVCPGADARRLVSPHVPTCRITSMLLIAIQELQNITFLRHS